jgi:hypothetical protein
MRYTNITLAPSRQVGVSPEHHIRQFLPPDVLLLMRYLTRHESGSVAALIVIAEAPQEAWKEAA